MKPHSLSSSFEQTTIPFISHSFAFRLNIATVWILRMFPRVSVLDLGPHCCSLQRRGTFQRWNTVLATGIWRAQVLERTGVILLGLLLALPSSCYERLITLLAFSGFLLYQWPLPNMFPPRCYPPLELLPGTELKPPHGLAHSASKTVS